MVQENRKVRYLLIEVTGRCNLKCVYCYNSDFNDEKLINQELPKEQILKIMNDAKDLGFNLIAFSGGEPFLRKDLLSIIINSPLPVSVLTNGTVVDEEIIDQLSKIKHFRELRFSLDGFVGNDITRGRGVGKKVLKNLLYAHKKGIKVSINTMVTKYNISDIIPLYEFIKNNFKNITWRIDLPFRSGRFKENFQNFEVSFDKLFAVYKELIKRYIEEKPDIKIEISNVFRRDILVNGFYSQDPSQHPCDYALGCATIRPNGDVSFCPSLNIVFGNLKNDKLVDVLKNKDFLKFCRIKIKDIKDCQNCKYLKICGSGCRADAFYLNNDILSKDDVSCKIIKNFHKHILPLLPDDKISQFEEMLK